MAQEADKQNPGSQALLEQNRKIRLSPLRRLAQWVLDAEIWVVAALVAASMASERLLPYTVAGAAFFWLVRLLAEKRLTRRTPADTGILLVAIMLGVTLWATALPEKTTPQVYRVLTGMLLYYALANWTTTMTRLRMVVNGVMLALLALAVTSPLTVSWPVGKLPFLPAALYERFVLLAKDTIHPNVFAATVGLLLPVGAGVLLYGWQQMRWVERLLAVVALLAGIAALGLTQSRGGWLAFAAALAILVLLRGRWGWLFLVVGAGVAAFGVYRLGLVRVLDVLAASNTLGGIEGRLEIWSRAIYMIQDFAFTGIGMGSYGEVADLLYPFFLAQPGSIPHAHNLFLQVAVDLGIPGLIGWLAVLMGMIFSAWHVYRFGSRQRDDWLRGLGAGLLASQVAMVVHGMLDAVVWGMVKPAPFVWGIWGLCAAGMLIVRSQEIEEKEKVNVEETRSETEKS